MNPILQLRWMIAVLTPYDERSLDGKTRLLLADLQAELATLQRFHDESLAAHKAGSMEKPPELPL